MLSAVDAYQIIDREVTALAAEELPLLEARGRFVAEAVASEGPLPSFDNSAMDGFALRARDVPRGTSREAPARLHIAGEVPAGRAFEGEVAEGEAVRIFTGAPIPAGTDAVVPVEQTAATEQGIVEIFARPEPGQHIRPAGQDVAAGEVVHEAGSRLDAGALGVLAAIGRPHARVHRAPRVALLVSGDEIVLPGEPLRLGQVRDVSTFTVGATLGDLGCETLHLGRVGDDRAALRAALEHALDEADVLVTTGGVSMGDYDLLRPVLKELGAEEIFWKVAQRPGKPLVFGRAGRALWFGLPGNPVSVWTCLQVYVVPMLRKMMGDPNYAHIRCPVVAGGPFDTRAPLTYFLRARLADVGGRLTAYLTGAQGSNITTSMLLADAICIVTPDVEEVRPGQPLEALLLDARRFAAAAADHLSVLSRRQGRPAGYTEGIDR